MEIVEIKEQIVEVAQATPSKQTADKGKSDYLDRFRQHMCKIVFSLLENFLKFV